MLKQTDNSRGFTIIEVVITIAIGAAVMALVLNAVQGARRAQRNTNRQADISAITAAVNQFVAARNALPPAVDPVVATSGIGPYLDELAHYPLANIEIGAMTGTLGSVALNTTYAAGTHTTATGARILEVADDDNADFIVLLTDAACAANDVAVASDDTDDLLADGGIREMVITYRLENDPNIYCEEI